jgi:hypothetical protein
MIKLFVGGFPPESEEMELAQLLSGFSQVSIIKIVRDIQNNYIQMIAGRVTWPAANSF